MGGVYQALGEYGKALDHYNRALALQKKVGDKSGQAETLNNLGALYDHFGEYDRALDSLEQTWNLARQAGAKKTEAIAVHDIAALLKHTGDTERSQKTYEIALQLRREAATLNNLGMVYLARGENAKALEAVQHALTIYRRSGDKRGEAAALVGMGSIHEALSDAPKALDFNQQAIPLLRAVGEESGQVSALENLMGIWEKLNRPRLDIFYGKLAVNLQQTLRGKIRTVERQMQQSCLRKSDWGCRFLTRLLLDEGRLSEAHQILNFFKDQESFDYEKVISPGDVPPLKEQFFTAEEEAAALRTLQGVSGRLSALEKSLGELQLVTGGRDPTPEESRQLAGLNAELSAAAAVYTLVLAERVSLLLVTPDRVALFSHAVKSSELNRKAVDFLGLLRDPAAEPRGLGKELYAILFAPVATAVEEEGIKTLVWSLDGALHYIPLTALYDGKQYLVERFQHVVFTRAARERMVAAVSPKWTGVGAGTTSPRRVQLLGKSYFFDGLPGGTAELGQIFGAVGDGRKGLLGGPVLMDEQFSFAALESALRGRPKLVHIASHFQFEPGDEERSFLLLGDGEALTLARLKGRGKIFDGVELLALSACETGAQQRDESTGREIDGFAELAQCLGAGAVMASLWKVADRSTAQLVFDFYDGRGLRGWSKAEALRQAQFKMMRGSHGAEEVAKKRGAEIVNLKAGKRRPFETDPKAPSAHPYYWAPFILIGNWR
ncbi:MAG TPA: CHAT domain-containing protein [Pyrinomonadaceae bacterium]|nr:CHAT domain-containing protein [Pyrinomonadaceae bacterium]